MSACGFQAESPGEQLKSAVHSKDIAKTKELLARGAPPDMPGDKGWSALMIAVMQDNVELTELLLDNKADLYTRTRNLQTPVHMAARWGKENTLAVLLKKRASTELRDELGWTPLMWAATRGKTRAVELLLNSGAKIDIMDSDGNTALMLSVWRGHAETARLLVSRGASLSARNSYGLNAAGVAKKNGFLDLASELASMAQAGARKKS